MADGQERAAESRVVHDLERARARLRLLADVGAALGSVLEPDEALRRLARLVVPQLADACVVDVLEEDRVRRLAVVHRDPERVLPYSSQEVLSVSRESSASVARVLRGAGPQLVTDSGAVGEPGSLQAAQAELYRALGAGTVLIVPLQVRQEVLGALSLVRSSTEEPFDEQEVSLCGDLGQRAGLALQNARLYALQQHIAEQMQLSLLPDLAGLGHLELTARYLPARAGAEVGGDWYDAFPLSDGSALLAIGDVVGHDLTAAVRMGQLRNMLRALAFDSGDSPAGLLSRLDGVMQGLSNTELATAVVSRIHVPASGPWEVQWSNAGHPPPVLADGRGGSRLLETGLAPVLGVDPGLTRENDRTELPPGSTLLFYTDGLVERPGENIERGLTRLRQQAAGLAREPLHTFCDELLARLTGTHQDDIAVLALRVPGG